MYNHLVKVFEYSKMLSIISQSFLADSSPEFINKFSFKK